MIQSDVSCVSAVAQWCKYPFGAWLVLDQSLAMSQCMFLSYFLFQPVLLDWCTKGHVMCYPVWDGANWKKI